MIKNPFNTRAVESAQARRDADVATAIPIRSVAASEPLLDILQRRYGPDLGRQIAEAEARITGSGPDLPARLRELMDEQHALEREITEAYERHTAALVPLQDTLSQAHGELAEAEAAWLASAERRRYVAAQTAAGIAADRIATANREIEAEVAPLLSRRGQIFQAIQHGPTDPRNWQVADWHMPSEPDRVREPARETIWVSGGGTHGPR